MKRPLLLALAFVFGGGCAVGPDFDQPSALTPEGVATLASSSATFTANEPAERWWAVFADPRLDALIEEARLKNQDHQAALARVQASRAVALQSKGLLLPTVSLNGSYTYQQYSGTGFFGGIGAAPFQSWTGTGDLSYELDLWGRLRRTIESADADAFASEEDRKTVEITLTADVADAWFDLGQTTESLAIARENEELLQETLGIATARRDAGAVGELAVESARRDLETARAAIPEAKRAHEVAAHRLAILLGSPPDRRFDASPSVAFDLPAEIPVGVPSTLLRRRPDVRAAELRVRSANAQIGAAIANYFPTLTLVGDAGYSSEKLTTIARPASQQWSLGPQLHIPIFQLATNYYLVSEKEARTQAAIADYRSIVLRAFAEVADAMSGIQGHREARDHDVEVVAASRRAVELAESSFKEGVTSYLDVLDAQRTLVQARTSLLKAQRDLLGDLVHLEKALGGGWTQPAEKEKP
ncbi:MAG TPA: efflux transporter outer membrane subunit [Planctomycetota bacterium]|nr:efflux transporter outer membrane subunit [Planctomycetota bacterium]